MSPVPARHSADCSLMCTHQRLGFPAGAQAAARLVAVLNTALQEAPGQMSLGTEPRLYQGSTSGPR